MNDKYLHIEFDDLLVDDAFLDWILKNKNSDEWEKWLSKHPEKRRLIKEAKGLITSIKFKHLDTPDQSREKIWQRIENSTKTKEIKIFSGRIKIYTALAVAASIALLAIFIYTTDSTVVATDLYNSKSIVLPAESQIEIAPGSRLKYNSKNWNSERSVNLEGFAHFNVSKGVPFKVATPNGTVEVLGTKFDVVSTQNSFYVKVEEGRVNAVSRNRSEILMTNYAFYLNPKWEGQYLLNERWKTEKMFFIFRNQSVKDVLEALVYTYGVEFAYSGINAALKFTGSFDSKEELNVVLEKILWPLNIQFEISEDKILLSSLK